MCAAVGVPDVASAFRCSLPWCYGWPAAPLLPIGQQRSALNEAGRPSVLAPTPLLHTRRVAIISPARRGSLCVWRRPLLLSADSGRGRACSPLGFSAHSARGSREQPRWSERRGRRAHGGVRGTTQLARSPPLRLSLPFPSLAARVYRCWIIHLHRRVTADRTVLPALCAVCPLSRSCRPTAVVPTHFTQALLSRRFLLVAPARGELDFFRSVALETCFCIAAHASLACVCQTHVSFHRHPALTRNNDQRTFTALDSRHSRSSRRTHVRSSAVAATAAGETKGAAEGGSGLSTQHRQQQESRATSECIVAYCRACSLVVVCAAPNSARGATGDWSDKRTEKAARASAALHRSRRRVPRNGLGSGDSRVTVAFWLLCLL